MTNANVATVAESEPAAPVDANRQPPVIDPAQVQCRSLALIPSRDRIVPPASAQALARALPNAHIHTVPLGHIGMIAGGRAVDVTYRPLIAWLKGDTNI